MQIQVTMQVLTPEGVPLIGAHVVECVVLGQDAQENILRAGAALEELAEQTLRSVRGQVERAST